MSIDFRSHYAQEQGLQCGAYQFVPADDILIQRIRKGLPKNVTTEAVDAVQELEDLARRELSL